MLSVKLPAEIRAYKSKLYFGLSVRQILSLIAAVLICVPVGVFGHKYISEELLTWIIILLAAPCIAVGFLRFHGMPFEEYIKCAFHFYTRPQKRVYEDTETNIFLSVREEILEEEIIGQRMDAGEYESEGDQLWES